RTTASFFIIGTSSFSMIFHASQDLGHLTQFLDSPYFTSSSDATFFNGSGPACFLVIFLHFLVAISALSHLK
ncbi:MAG TPA: hypothetical protein VFG28_05585, partial [Syntrophales bacterium]|nr:hypothetical protein [Syntrophales bacterium]